MRRPGEILTAGVDRLPGILAWRTARPSLSPSSLPTTEFAHLPSIGGIVALVAGQLPLMTDTKLRPVEQRAADGRRNLARLFAEGLTTPREPFPPPLPQHVAPAGRPRFKTLRHTDPARPQLGFDTAYTHIASCGQYFAGVRCSSRLSDTCLPLVPPTTLELWACHRNPSSLPAWLGMWSSTSRAVVAPRGVLKFVRTLQLPPVWVYDIAMVKTTRGTLLALLTTWARMVDSSPHPSDWHWVSSRGSRAVHLFYLDEGSSNVLRVPAAGRVVVSPPPTFLPSLLVFPHLSS